MFQPPRGIAPRLAALAVSTDREGRVVQQRFERNRDAGHDR
jgi:hypothetical protein